MAALGVQDLISGSHFLALLSLRIDRQNGSYECGGIVKSKRARWNQYVSFHPTSLTQKAVPNQLPPYLSPPIKVVVIDDHIALPLLTGLNPLRGPLSRPSAARFVPLSDAYSRPLRLAAFRAAHELDLPREALAEGTYAWVSGPTYETRGEAALLGAAGASVVGMSTVPEVVAARDEGLRVLVLSLVTNMVVGVVPGGNSRSVREELEAEVRARCHRRWVPRPRLTVFFVVF